ncbi:Hsp70 family protein [Pendulispora albinea]|uniref:Hsp70 family protein n=1 Tax=Pendulispora albinea TaxID=2741071 RepID=A0ABZ2M846_9BACT
MSARVVGIDLGTTNTLLAFSEEGSAPRIFAVPQLVSRTEIEARELFPSCLFAPTPGEVEGDPFQDAPYVAGELARRRGAEVPGRLIVSAKSWLCHSGVDRAAPILPWGSEDESIPKVSPLDASTRYLAHLRTTYDAAFPDAPLAAADVVLTVPASFDQGARELTLEAAARAGLSVRLLEEPQAAFYDCMQRIGVAGLEALLARSRSRSGSGAGANAEAGSEEAHVLVCDVGGGTTDLSLIRVTRGEHGPLLSRVATGHHLLLGGDNMDLTLAHLCEERLATRFDPGRFAQLTAACRAAKERLLGDGAPESAQVTVLGHGARLVGGAQSTELGREEVERIVLEGFFPRVERDARPSRSRGALVAFGLPYERDVAITRHIAWFVARHVPDGTPIDAILLNGGVFRAPRITERMAEVIRAWHPSDEAPIILPHPDPDFGVARGAVAYGLSLRGHGLRIEGGAAHGYYVALGEQRAISVVPRGTKEEVTTVAEGTRLALTVGRPVRFDLFTSDDARIDPAGSVVTLDDEHFTPLPPAAVTFRADETKGEVGVVLEGKLTAIGTLDLACVEADPPAGKAPRRFRLAFQLRAPAADKAEGRGSSLPPAPATSLRGKRFEEARELIDRAFGKPRPDASPRDAKDLVRELERLLGERSSWTTHDARALFDALLPFARGRRRSADHERVFWLLAGYCVRPGFGDPNDPARVGPLFALFPEKLAFPEGPRGWQQFFIALRRMGAGLDEAAQVLVLDTFEAFLAPADRGKKKPKKLKPESLDELLETVSTFERLPANRRSELGGWILERTWTERDPRLWAALGRIGARVPAYASVHHVVTPLVAERWLDHLLREKWELVPTAPRAAVELSRVTDDRARDVSERVRREVDKRLVKLAAKPEWIRAVREHVPVEEADRAAFYGEGLPRGLRLVDPGP